MTAITAKVPIMEKGRARLGMAVAGRLRRKRKITSTTSPRLSSIENRTSLKEFFTASERSTRISISTAGGSCCRKTGMSFLTESATSTVLLPGCFCIARMMDRRTVSGVMDQLTFLSSSTLSITFPNSSR